MKLGLRLQQWSQEPPVSAVTASLFKLDPGQDQAFANAVLLHLVDAFRTGNNFTRLCILKVLLLESRSRKHFRRNGKPHCKGLLTKDRIPNHVEVLKRVKAVMDSGDMIARALALRVIGCLADLARDSADTHCMVFEALHSPHQQEVNAALFVVGCLCELSEPFSSLALERLADIVNAMETTPETRLRGIRAFSQMDLSTSIALKAYETGKGLMLKFPTDEFIVTSLEALSKLAFKSSIILADQVDLLLSYLSSDPRAIVRAVSLKCLIRLSKKATGWIPFEEKSFELMLSILEDVNLPSGLQTLAFQALRKLSPHYAVAVDAGHLINLLSVAELNALHQNWSRVQPVLSLLVDLACHVERMREEVWKSADEQMGLGSFILLGETDTETPAESLSDKGPIIKLDFVTRIALLICDHVALTGCRWNLVDLKQKSSRVISTEWSEYDDTVSVKERCHFLCRLLLQLVEGCPQSGFVIVDCLAGMVEAVLEKIQQTLQCDQQQSCTESVPLDKSMWPEADLSVKDSIVLERQCNSRPFRLCLLKMLCLCLRGCVTILDSKEEQLSRTFGRLNKLVSCCCTNFGVSHDVLSNVVPILLKISEYSCAAEAQKIATKVFSVAEHFIRQGEFWAAYKLSIWAASHGLWTGVPSVMDLVAARTQSDGCYFWLRALAEISISEARIQGECQKIRNPNARDEYCIVVSEKTNIKDATCTSLSWNLGEAVAKALPHLRFAASSLAAAVNLDRTFEFQRWLLALRIALLECTGELLGLLGPVCVDLKESDIQMLNTSMINPRPDDVFIKQMISSIQAVAKKSEALSLQFRKLVIELDVLSVSFMGIDKESLHMLSCTALGCSLLSFCTTFAFFFPEARSSTCFPQSQRGLIAADLYQRLETVGGEEWSELLFLSLQLGNVHASPIRVRWSSCVLPSEKKLLNVTRWAVREVLNLQEEARMKEEEMLCQVQARGIYVLKGIVEKWFCLPWMLPKYFLCTRPRVGIEVFVGRMDIGDSEDIVISQGATVPLSLCFQIRNVHINGGSKVKKLSCALLLKPAERQNFVDEEFYTGWRLGWCEDQVMDNHSHVSLIGELLLNLRMGFFTSEEMVWESYAGVGDRRQNTTCEEDLEVSVSKTIVVCDVDRKGQAFASCLLNTTDVQCGLFRITLQAACLDDKGYHWILLPLNTGRILRILPIPD